MLVQFSIISLVIIVVLAAVSITTLNIRLNNDMELLRDHGNAMMSGTMIESEDPFSIPSLESDIENLKWIITGILAGGLAVLYLALVNIVRNGWVTINRQRTQLIQRVREVEETTQQLHDEIRERTEIEGARRLIEVKAMEQSKLASLGQVATGIAHEINQPLTYINTMIQTMREDIELDDLDTRRAHQGLTESHRQVERISSIIDHLRIFGRIDNLVTEEISIDDVVQNTLLLIGEWLRLSDITIDIQNDENLVTIRGNANQLEQVFLNLLQNASDALSDDQRNAKKITVAIRSTPDQSAVQVELSDNGAGIASEHFDKIFEPFFTTKDVGKGTGLGLSVAHGIVREHGGTITCESKLNEGTTFLITLPAQGAQLGQT
jgi:C4-dicarboxylate-specific signal transduction histidine kinase